MGAIDEQHDDRGKQAVLLLSGGLDSATVLAMAVREGFACHCVSFDYGQRHLQELDAADRIARALGAATHRVVRLDPAAFAGSALTDNVAVPKGRVLDVQGPDAGDADSAEDAGNAGDARDTSDRAHEIPVTYVPARNLIFLSYAIGLAEVLGARDVFIGVNQLDYSGYPDCRAAFIEAFTRAANLATKAGVEGSPCCVRTPLIDMTKAQIINAGVKLGVDYSLTRSCYDPAPSPAPNSDADGLACGRCDACVLRRDGFRGAGVADPTRYVEDAR